MNAANLIDDVLAEISDEQDTTRAEVLSRLNKAQLAVAGKILMPDLADGNTSVLSVLGSSEADMPADFHRHIFMAQIDNYPVRTYLSFPLFLQEFNSLSDDAGDIIGIVTKGLKLIYQGVPSDATTIALQYYRLPVDMTDVSTSYPDGISNSEEYVMCLFHYACWKLFARVEDYTEAKHDTMYHKKEYQDYLVELGHACSKLNGPEVIMPESGVKDFF